MSVLFAPSHQLTSTYFGLEPPLVHLSPFLTTEMTSMIASRVFETTPLSCFLPVQTCFFFLFSLSVFPFRGTNYLRVKLL
jgi:hypothetical protein